MNTEETILKELVERFELDAGLVRVARARRLSVEAPPEQFRPMLEHIVNGMQFRHLCTITGLDEGEKLAFVYHLARADGVVINLKTSAPKTAPAIRTVTDIFPGAASYERELESLLGAQVEGLPPGNRYPLDDKWPACQFPLRKDWKPEMPDATTR